VEVEITSFEGDSRAQLETTLAMDDAGGGRLENDTNLYRIRARATGGETVSVLVALGGVPARAIGRVTPSGAPPAAVFCIDTQGLLRTPDRSTELLLFARDDQAQLTGPGWSPVDWDAVSPYRWMTAPEARLVLPVARDDARKIRLQALLEEGGRSSTIGLRLNGTELAAQSLRSGWHTYEWSLPAGLIRRATNDLVVIVDELSPPQEGGAGARGVALTDLRIIHGED
jgi:hypothetical protein